MHSEPNDDEHSSIKRAQRGDLAAFSELVKCHQSMVRAFLAERLATPCEADDLAQEVFITAFRRLRQFSTDRPLGPWLRGIAYNHLRNHRRKFRALPIGGNVELQDMLDREFDQRAKSAQEAPRVDALRRCLAELDEASRAILEARYVDGETVREIEKRTKRGYSALTMQLHRIRTRLAGCIERKLAGSAPA